MYTYRRFSSKDAEAIRKLVKATFPEFLEGDYWDWKYLNNPDFDPSLVSVAEKDGKIVGCSNWICVSLKISRSVTVKSILAGELAVYPEHRNRGVGKSLLRFLREARAFKPKGAIANHSFADPQLVKRFYQPSVGYVPTRSSTRAYYKLLGWRRITENLEKASVWEARAKTTGKSRSQPLSLLLKLRGAPPLAIRISREGIRAIDESSEADIVIEGDLATLSSLGIGGTRRGKLLKALITRKIKVKGKLVSLFRLYRSLGAIEKTLRRLDLGKTALQSPRLEQSKEDCARAKM